VPSPAVFFVPAGSPYLEATGGTITTPGDGYRYHEFLTSGTFEIEDVYAVDVEIFVVGQGAAGDSPGSGGAGSKAAYVKLTDLTAGTFAVTVAATSSVVRSGVVNVSASVSAVSGADISYNGGSAGWFGGGNGGLGDLCVPFNIRAGGGGGGGGTGGSYPDGRGGDGGSNGGGSGGWVAFSSGTPGTAGTGGGGGGGASFGAPGAWDAGGVGGSGRVLFRYPV
jgi:hypothetical protein